MLFALAAALLGSVLTQDDGTAVVLAVVVGAGLCVLMPAVYLAQAHFSPASRPLSGGCVLKPGLRAAPCMARVSRRVWRPRPWPSFWLNLGVTLAWSALCLGAASDGA